MANLINSSNSTETSYRRIIIKSNFIVILVGNINIVRNEFH